MLVASNRIVRFAAEDVPLTIRTHTDAETVAVTVGETTEKLTVEGGSVTLPASMVDALMPELGRYDLKLDEGDVYGYLYVLERVSARYCTPAELIEYGRVNNDGFEDSSRYPAEKIEAAIQQAEEVIDRACARSFCKRSKAAVLWPRAVVDLPVVDAYAISSTAEGVKLISDSQVTGVTEQCEVVIDYGTELDATIQQATLRLASWFLRPRGNAENARGTSMEGVYISYDLATGEDGSWTGLPYVDAAIEQHRSRRVLVG